MPTLAPHSAAPERTAPTNVQASDRLRADILSGAIPFGTRLTIAALAKRYAVSHMPIREALRHLQGEGLLTITPNRGARVRNVDIAFVRNMFDLRVAIEAMLTRRAAERIDAAGLARLESEQLRLERCAARGDVAGVLAANRAFHQVVYDASDNPEALEIANRHWGLVSALWAIHRYDAERFGGVISDHRQIMAALAAHDGEAANALALAHSTKAKQDLIRKMSGGFAPIAGRQ
ncbi:MAG: GntR family transcriptional regulator [Alphaproteobacteria bacterium]|nr:GntR family transcriptional regulator [Alphaproteobacteria bacterium]